MGLGPSDLGRRGVGRVLLASTGLMSRGSDTYSWDPWGWDRQGCSSYLSPTGLGPILLDPKGWETRSLLSERQVFLRKKMVDLCSEFSLEMFLPHTGSPRRTLFLSHPRSHCRQTPVTFCKVSLSKYHLPFLAAPVTLPRMFTDQMTTCGSGTVLHPWVDP